MYVIFALPDYSSEVIERLQNLFVLHAQVESGTNSRDSSRFPRRRPFMYTVDCHMPSGQFQVYQATQLRTDGVDCRESAGAGLVVLKVVPVTGTTLPFQVSPRANRRAPLFFPGFL